METEVIIVGAGAAGLAAAKTLSNLGKSFILVEGSHRIGGRAYSEEIAPGVWFDLGCSYLHQADKNPFVDIAKSLNHPIGEEFGDIFDFPQIRFHADGQELTPKARTKMSDYLNQCSQAIKDDVESGKDSAIADLIDLDHEYAPIYLSAMAELMTLDLDQVSAEDYFNSDEGPDFPIKNGYGNLVSAWGRDIPVSLNTRVEKIDTSGKQVEVQTASGTIKASTVLVTVSTGILASQQIEFLPALPVAKQDAIAGIPCGTENKICLHFGQDVFGDDGRGFHYSWGEGYSAGFEASVMGQNTAIVFTGGRHAVWLEKQGQEASKEYAVETVASVFGNNIRSQVTASIATAWTTEPWTLGSYSCGLPGQAHQREQLAASIDDKLFFAGEATIIGPHACCHGAYLSGVRAAKEIASCLD